MDAHRIQRRPYDKNSRQEVPFERHHNEQHQDLRSHPSHKHNQHQDQGSHPSHYHHQHQDQWSHPSHHHNQHQDQGKHTSHHQHLNQQSHPSHYHHQQQKQQQFLHLPTNETQYFQSESTYPYSVRAKQQQMMIDEKELNVENEGDVDGKVSASSSTWQRVKWSDNMVMFLFVAIHISSYCESLARKGKWKYVSKAMEEKGYHVSSQQCEDKFNDMNKKYKRLIDILGNGIACEVVENPSLLKYMDHISPEMKEEVKKLLNSKQLFFQELCAHHNSNGGSSNKDKHNEDSRTAHHCIGNRDENNRDTMEGNNNEGEDNEEVGDASRKRKNNGEVEDDYVEELKGKLMDVLQERSKSQLEQRHWLKKILVELEREKGEFQRHAFKLSLERNRWIEYRAHQERRLEEAIEENERARLKNDKMIFLLKQKEFEFVEKQRLQKQQLR